MLTSFQQFKVRQLVGLFRSIQSQHRQVYEQQKQARNQLNEAKRSLRQAKEETEFLLGGHYQYTPEERAKVAVESKARIEACEMAMRELEMFMAELDLQEKSLQPVMRQTGKLAESLINTLDRNEHRFRDELKSIPVDGRVSLDPAQIANQYAPAAEFTRQP